jgi:hypothetical protein
MKAIVLFFLLTCSAFAANFYVRPNGGSYGSENGSDWNNAFDGFGDIAWAIFLREIPFGSPEVYTQDLMPTKSGSAGNVIAIRRARSDASACTSAAAELWIQFDGRHAKSIDHFQWKL